MKTFLFLLTLIFFSKTALSSVVAGKFEGQKIRINGGLASGLTKGDTTCVFAHKRKKVACGKITSIDKYTGYITFDIPHEFEQIKLGQSVKIVRGKALLTFKYKTTAKVEHILKNKQFTIDAGAFAGMIKQDKVCAVGEHFKKIVCGEVFSVRDDRSYIITKNEKGFERLEKGYAVKLYKKNDAEYIFTDRESIRSETKNSIHFAYTPAISRSYSYNSPAYPSDGGNTYRV